MPKKPIHDEYKACLMRGLSPEQACDATALSFGISPEMVRDVVSADEALSHGELA